MRKNRQSSIRIFIGLITFQIIIANFFGCTRSSENSEFNPPYHFKKGRPNTTVSVTLLNSEVNQLVLSYHTFADTVFVNKKGQFEFELSLKASKFFNLKDGNHSITIYIEPKDHLQITYNGNQVYESIEYSGTGALTNTYLMQRNRAQNQCNLSIAQQFHLPPNQFIQIIDSCIEFETHQWDEFTHAQPNLSEDFKKFMNAKSTYYRGAILLEYLNSSNQADDLNKNEFLNFLDSLSLEQHQLLEVFEYRQFLDAFIEYKTQTKLEQQIINPADLVLRKMQEVSVQITNVAIKDYLLYNYLKGHLKYYGFENTQQLFQTFKYQCNNEVYTDEMLALNENYKRLGNKPKAPPITMVDLTMNPVTLSKFKGSYVYIDVWATWCIPCRKEAPYFEELELKYRHKNIEFVSLSIDANPNDWIKYLESNTSATHHYRITDVQSFLDAYMIKTIPHFLIIEPTGNLFDSNAQRPSDIQTQWFDALPDRVMQ